MASTITGISSMATRQVLAELAARYRAATGWTVAIEAMGGVDAAKRVRAGEAFDLVILADDVLEKLETEGHLVADSRVGFVRSPMAMAVRAGEKRPDIASAEGVRAALMSARTIGYSTGPSGTHLLAVLKSWGLDAAAEPGRLVQAKPGVPVATLVASGEAAIGIQQLSELLGQPGLDIIGTLPPPVQSVTTFSMGIGARSTHVEEARAVIASLNASETVETKRRFGMEPA
ncbi:MAG: putative prokaryotic extracellular metal-binding protein [Rhodospirillales bacterium]|jgi:molybdate transport system substrate-binding protein|nr:putative prokaryotic extracellular metal-binding protein [Rhodospirillales bacterium]